MPEHPLPYHHLPFDLIDRLPQLHEMCCDGFGGAYCVVQWGQGELPGRVYVYVCGVGSNACFCVHHQASTTTSSSSS